MMGQEEVEVSWVGNLKEDEMLVSSMMDWRLDWVWRNGQWEFVLWCGNCGGIGRSGGFPEGQWLLAKRETTEHDVLNDV